MRITKAFITSIKKNPSAIAKTLSDEELEKLLRKLADAYYNTELPLVDDTVYDILYDILKERDPSNPFLKEAGSKVKVDRKKVELKYPMGSLTKIKPNEGDLNPWLKKYLGPYVVSDKLDGVSAQIYKTPEGKLEMYTRGKGDDRGNVGEDITHLLKYINVGDIDSIEDGYSIRGELIIKKKDFDKIKEEYKNIRNTVSGIVNSKTLNVKLAKLVNFVAYAILNPELKQEEQMKKLNKMKINCAEYKVVKKIDEKFLESYLKERRTKSEYDVDGVVIVDSAKVYPLKAGNPDNAFAFKMVLDDQYTIAEVVKVNWDYSMDSYCKPTVTIKPVELVGVTITNATAYNADFVWKNKLGPRAEIKIIRSGDVIPKIMEVTKPANNPQMPTIPYIWNDTEVDIMIDYTKKIPQEVKDRVLVNLLIHFFSTLGIKYISEGILTKLVSSGYKTVGDIVGAIIELDEDLYEIDGVGEKIIKKIAKEIVTRLDKAELHTFMDATHIFGKGIGSRKLKEIIKIYPDIMTHKVNIKTRNDIIENIKKIDGFAELTATRFVNNLEKFKTFYEDFNKVYDITHMIKINKPDKTKTSTKFKDDIIVFTGIRDDELQKQIEDQCGKVTGSVSKNTTILITSDNPDTGTEKYKKAKTFGIKIYTISEFRKQM